MMKVIVSCVFLVALATVASALQCHVCERSTGLLLDEGPSDCGSNDTYLQTCDHSCIKTYGKISIFGSTVRHTNRACDVLNQCDSNGAESKSNVEGVDVTTTCCDDLDGCNAAPGPLATPPTCMMMGALVFSAVMAVGGFM